MHSNHGKRRVAVTLAGWRSVPIAVCCCCIDLSSKSLSCRKNPPVISFGKSKICVNRRHQPKLYGTTPGKLSMDLVQFRHLIVVYLEHKYISSRFASHITERRFPIRSSRQLRSTFSYYTNDSPILPYFHTYILNHCIDTNRINVSVANWRLRYPSE